MNRKERNREDAPALKPIGFALAAVVSGLGAQAQAHPAVEHRVAPPPPNPETTRVHYIDPTNHPAFDEDPDMILGPSAPMEPFAETARVQTRAKSQGDLFD